MSKDSDFDYKISLLEQEVQNLDKPTTITRPCMPLPIILGIATPVIVLVLLLLSKPRFLLKKQGKKLIRDKVKTFKYTIALTLIIWIGIYLKFYYFKKH